MKRIFSIGLLSIEEPIRTTVLHCITEFVATLLFVYLGCGVVVSSWYTEKGQDPGIAVGLTNARLLVISFGHGFTILLLVFATAHISGGHLNPAVTLAMMVTQNMPILKGLGYMFSQFAGGVVGALILRASFSDPGTMGEHMLGNGITVFGGILIEFILTFMLVYTIFSTAVNPNAPPHLAPIAIGLAVLAGHLMAVPFTGASMNPARTLAAAMVADVYGPIHVYFIGPPLGAVCAGLLYQHTVINPIKNAIKRDPLLGQDDQLSVNGTYDTDFSL